MQKAQTHAKKRRTNPILLLVILALVVLLGVELIRVGKRLNEAAQQQAALERQLQQQTQENQAAQAFEQSECVVAVRSDSRNRR